MFDLSNPAVRLKEVGPVCKYHKTGFCKFRDRCRSRHNDEICGNHNECKVDQCNKRHPKICKNFNKSGNCRHNKNCAYQHVVQKNKCGDKEEIKLLTSKVYQLEETIQNMMEHMNSLEKEINKINKRDKRVVFGENVEKEKNESKTSYNESVETKIMTDQSSRKLQMKDICFPVICAVTSAKIRKL